MNSPRTQSVYLLFDHTEVWTMNTARTSKYSSFFVDKPHRLNPGWQWTARSRNSFYSFQLKSIKSNEMMKIQQCLSSIVSVNGKAIYLYIRDLCWEVKLRINHRSCSRLNESVYCKMMDVKCNINLDLKNKDSASHKIWPHFGVRFVVITDVINLSILLLYDVLPMFFSFASLALGKPYHKTKHN